MRKKILKQKKQGMERTRKFKPLGSIEGVRKREKRTTEIKKIKTK